MLSWPVATAYANAHAYACPTSCLASPVCLACLTPGLPYLPGLLRSLASLDYCAHVLDSTEDSRDSDGTSVSFSGSDRVVVIILTGRVAGAAIACARNWHYFLISDMS